LLDGVSGDEVDEEEDERDYQPDYWQGVEDALEELAEHEAVASGQWLVFSQICEPQRLSSLLKNSLR
jgi:hypothetical protein